VEPWSITASSQVDWDEALSFLLILLKGRKNND